MDESKKFLDDLDAVGVQVLRNAGVPDSTLAVAPRRVLSTDKFRGAGLYRPLQGLQPTKAKERNVVIFDLDNCLTHDAWRRAFINPELPMETRWDDYNERSLVDKPNAEAVRVLREHQEAGRRVVIFTARPSKFRHMTKLWLARHVTKKIPVVMRPDGDHSPSPELKVGMLKRCEIDPSEVFIAYDDRDDVLEAYRAIGIPAQKFIADEEHTDDGRDAERAPDFLERGAATFRERNATYGDTYLAFGRALEAMFPQGLSIKTAEDWNRVGIFVQCAGKLARYAPNLASGGHKDSAHDLMVYAAMLEELTEEGE